MKRIMMLALACVLSVPASAAVITLDAPDAALSNMTGVMSQRLRFDRGGGLDQVTFKQPSLVGAPNRDLLRMNSTNTGTASYTFVVTHTAATQTFKFDLLNGSVTGGASFANANAANSTLTQSFAANELSYNILHVYGLSNNGNNVSFSNLSFTAGNGLSTVGSVETSGSVTNGEYHQWFAAPTGTNLGDFDWALSARVTLSYNGVASSSEALKFELSGKQGIFVPEPGSLSVLALSMGLLARRRA